MSRRRVERLLNLTMCLMATSRFLTVSEIGEMVEGYEPGETEESQAAFRRMFERDKQYLRQIGIPIETGSDSAFSDEVGYRIRRGDYALPEISLDPDEFAALALAASLWSTQALAAPAASALRKLAAAGAPVRPAGLSGPAGEATGLAGLDSALDGDLDGAGPAAARRGGALPVGPGAGFEPRVGATEEAFEPCLAAVRAGRAIRFPYRKPGQAEPEQRHVEPWGVLSWHGRWYLVGHDVNRGAPRVFRLSRVTGPVRAVGPAGAVTVPPGVDLRAMVGEMAPPEHTRTAVLRIRRGAGHALRRRGRLVQPAAPGTIAAGHTTTGHGLISRDAAGAGAEPEAGSGPGPRADGGPDGPGGPQTDLVEVDFSDTMRMARWIVGFGPDVVVVGPPDLREEVIRRLTATAQATARSAGLAFGVPAPAGASADTAAAVGSG